MKHTNMKYTSFNKKTKKNTNIPNFLTGDISIK